MKKLLIGAVALLFATSVTTGTAFARGGGHGGGHSHSSFGGSRSHSSSEITHVHSYTRSNGTFVHSHDRTHENGTMRDNWSSKGNVNPETGKPGTVTPTH